MIDFQAVDVEFAIVDGSILSDRQPTAEVPAVADGDLDRPHPVNVPAAADLGGERSGVAQYGNRRGEVSEHPHRPFASLVSRWAISTLNPKLAALKKCLPLTSPRSTVRMCPSAMMRQAAPRSVGIPRVLARSLAVPRGKIPSGKPVSDRIGRAGPLFDRGFGHVEARVPEQRGGSIGLVGPQSGVAVHDQQCSSRHARPLRLRPNFILLHGVATLAVRNCLTRDAHDSAGVLLVADVGVGGLPLRLRHGRDFRSREKQSKRSGA